MQPTEHRSCRSVTSTPHLSRRQPIRGLCPGLQTCYLLAPRGVTPCLTCGNAPTSLQQSPSAYFQNYLSLLSESNITADQRP